MPILRGSVTFARFRAEHPKKAPSDVRRWLVRGLQASAFEPIDRKSDEDRSAGFVELEDRDQVEFAPSALFYGERALFSWRIDKLRVPAGQLRDELARWAQDFERENERKPSRLEKGQHKEAVRQKLRSQAVPVMKAHDVCWNLKTGEVQLWAASRTVVEEIVGVLEANLEVRLRSPLDRALGGEGELKPTLELIGVEEVSHGA